MLCRAHEGGVRRRDVVFPLFLLSLLGWEAATAVPLKAHLAPRSGGRPPAVGFGVCLYGGSEYSEGEAVVTDEQCLNCTCSRGALVCHLRACPPLPDGCVRMEGNGSCCPTIVCDEANEPEGPPAIKELTYSANATGCDVEGQHHEEGSRVPEMAGHCEDCLCSGGRIQCAPTPCSPAPSDCTPVIVRGEDCCPTRYECLNAPSLALPEIDLGSNFESVLVPPSLEELLNYFGTNSTKETKLNVIPMSSESPLSLPLEEKAEGDELPPILCQ